MASRLQCSVVRICGARGSSRGEVGTAGPWPAVMAMGTSTPVGDCSFMSFCLPHSGRWMRWHVVPVPAARSPGAVSPGWGAHRRNPDADARPGLPFYLSSQSAEAACPCLPRDFPVPGGRIEEVGLLTQEGHRVPSGASAPGRGTGAPHRGHRQWRHRRLPAQHGATARLPGRLTPARPRPQGPRAGRLPLDGRSRRGDDRRGLDSVDPCHRLAETDGLGRAAARIGRFRL